MIHLLKTAKMIGNGSSIKLILSVLASVTSSKISFHNNTSYEKSVCKASGVKWDELKKITVIT